MNERGDEVYQAASMYYVHGDTMETIARQLRVSRSTVSRMLKDARESGVVRISLAEPVAGRGTLALAIQRRYGVRTHVVGVKLGTSDVVRLDRVARVAAGLAADCVGCGAVVGVAWGTTLAAIANHLPHREVPGVTIVQLNGSATPAAEGIPYVGAQLQQFADAWQASVQSFPVPAFFDYAATREQMWRERSIRRVIELQQRASVAIFGVGSTDGPLPSHVYSSGYLDQDDLAQLKAERVVGDVCTVFLREDGTWRDVAMNARASGPTPEALRAIERRICVVAHEAKMPALRAALRARVATDLVLDDGTARALLGL